MLWRGVAFMTFWRGVAFFRALAVLWRCACSILEGCGIFGGHLLCFEGVFAVFWRGVAFLEGTCSV